MLDPIAVPVIRPEVGESIAAAFQVAFIRRAAKYAPTIRLADLGVAWLSGKQQLRVWMPPDPVEFETGRDNSTWIRMTRAFLSIYGFDAATTIREGAEGVADILERTHFLHEGSAMYVCSQGIKVDGVKRVEDSVRETVNDDAFVPKPARASHGSRGVHRRS